MIIAEITGYDPGTLAEVTWRFSEEGYDAAGVWYDARIENPALLTRAISGVEGGRVSLSYGEMTLINIDGALDTLSTQFFDGRTLKVFVVRPSDPPSKKVMILNAQIESIAVERSRVSVRLRDRAVTLDKPFSSLKYAGDNLLPYGIEGTADDLKDQPKPFLYGRVALLSPVQVNTSKLIYQVSANPVIIFNVFDGGAYLNRTEEDYVSQEDMELNEPAAGSYRAWPEGGCFRLASSPFGEISVCAADSVTPSDVSGAGLLKRIVRKAAENRPDSQQPADAWDWHWKDLQALDERNAGSMGLMVGAEETTASILDRICMSMGAFWGFDALGAMRVVRFDAPSGTPVCVLNDDNMISFERRPDEQLPWQAVTMRADMNYAVQDKTGLAGCVSTARATWFGLESRDQKYADADVKAQRLLSEETTFESLFNGIATAQAEAARRVDLLATPRDYLLISLAHPLAYVNLIDLGTVVEVQTSRLGLTAGKLFIVTSVRADFRANLFEIEVFG